MKRTLLLCALLLTVFCTASAAQTAPGYTTSDWARQDVLRAMELLSVQTEDMGLDPDLRKPIDRGSFAEKAAALLATEFGFNLESYLIITNYRTYPVPILRSASGRGEIQAEPKNPRLSADGQILFYTATLPADAYRITIDSLGNDSQTLFFPKGVYTVAIDLKAGTQTYIRTDLPN